MIEKNIIQNIGTKCNRGRQTTYEGFWRRHNTEGMVINKIDNVGDIETQLH